MRISVLLATCLLLLLFHATAAAQTKVRPFELRTTTGESFQLKSSADRSLTVVAFLGTECPLAKLYCVRLNQLADEFETVRFVGINSNRQDSEEELLEFRKTLNVQFPLARDHRNIVADLFDAQRTPEVFVVDHQLHVVYRGRVDDQYLPGISKPRSSRDDLRIALQEWLDGKLVSQSQTEVAGCIIGRVKQSDQDARVTFSNQVSRVLQRHCVECHRADDIGPFSLTDYEEVVGWGDMLVEVVDEGRMPPWHADAKHGRFSNSRHMSEADKQILRDWVDSGAPFGKPDELPMIPTRTEGWKLSREPDLEIAMRDRPFVVPAEGTVEYQYFVVDPGFEEDKWVTGAEVVPGNRSVVHHSIVFIRPPDGEEFLGLGWLAAYVPGQREVIYPPGYGRRIPAGSKLVFQQHYTPVGSQQDDITRIGLVFSDASEIHTQVFSTVAIDQEFEIPPGADNHTVNTQVRFLPEQGKLLSFAPHMHYRGKSCCIVVETDGKKETVLNVPRYDFNWQHSYVLQEPLDLATVDRIRFSATFDNSSGNPVNPDPSQAVYWGDQTWEEMAISFFEVAVPREYVASGMQPSRPVQRDYSDREKEACEKFVDGFFERFDRNGDGQIVKNELPYAMRSSLGYWDAGSDGALQRDDIIRQVEPDFRTSEEFSEIVNGQNRR